MKRRYEKISMKVYELSQRPQLLVGSGEPKDGDQWLNYMPGQPADEKRLA